MSTEEMARRIFDHARIFSNAAYALNDVPQMDLVFPQSVCAALALELYVKTLYLLEKKKEPQHSHDFHHLFMLLDINTRNKIELTFNQLMTQKDKFYFENLENTVSVSIPRDLIGNLFSWKEVFVKLRYAYEPLPKEFNTFLFPEIEKSILDFIILIKPEWRNTTSHTWQKIKSINI